MLQKIWLLILILLVLGLSISYFLKIDDVPFVRLDDGELLQLSTTFAQNGHLGCQMMETGHGESSAYHVHPPLYYITVGIIFKVFGPGLVPTRATNLLFSLLVIIGTFVLWRQIRSPGTTVTDFLILALLLLSTPMFFVMARSMRPEMLAALLTLIALSLLQMNRAKQSAIYFGLIGLVSGASLLTQAYEIFLAIYLGLAIFFISNEKAKSLIFFFSGLIVGLLPYCYWLSQDFASFYYQTIIARKASQVFILTNIFTRYYNFFSRFENLAATLFFLSLLGYLFSKKAHFDQSLRGFILPILSFLAVFIFLPVMNKYYYLIILPFIYLLAVYCLNKFPSRVINIIIAVYLMVNLGGLAFYWLKYKDHDYSAYINKIRLALPSPGNFALLASPSLYPGLPDYTFYSLNNGSIINSEQSRNSFSARLKQLQIRYLIVEEFNEQQFKHHDYFNKFIASDCLLTATIFDKYYGSEGTKANNYTRIFRIRP